MPDIADVADHGRPARGDRRDASPAPRPATRSTLTNTGNIAPGRAVRAGRADPGLDQRARPAARPAAARPACRCPAATTSAPARSTCTSTASRRWAPTFELSHGYLEAHADRLHGADIIARLPAASGRPRTSSPPRCCAKGTTHRQRRPRAGDRRPVRHARRRWAPTSRASARRRSSIARRRAGLAARRSTTTVVPTASRRPPTSPRSPSPAAS